MKKKNPKISFHEIMSVFFSALLHLTVHYHSMKNNYRVEYLCVGTWKIKLFIKEVEGIMPTRYMSFFLHKTWHLFGLIFFLFACPGFLLGSYLNRVNLDYNNYVQSHISIELDPNLLIHILSTMVFNNCFAFILC